MKSPEEIIDYLEARIDAANALERHLMESNRWQEREAAHAESKLITRILQDIDAYGE